MEEKAEPEKKESIVLQIQNLRHGQSLGDLGLKQKHVLQIQGLRHVLKSNVREK